MPTANLSQVNTIGGIITALLLSYLVFVDGGLNIFLAVLVLFCFLFGIVIVKLYMAVFVLFCFLFGIGGINFFLSVSMLGYFLFVNFVSTTAASVDVDIQNVIFSRVAGLFNDYLPSVARIVMSLEWFVLFGLLIGNALFHLWNWKENGWNTEI